jgi:type IV secretion system protein VirB11
MSAVPDTAQTSVVSLGQAFLEQFLAPLRHFLDDPDVSEICCNEPGGIWVERFGVAGMERYALPALTGPLLQILGRSVAGSTAQAINRKHPLLSAALPTGERIQFVLAPTARSGGGFAIRKQVFRDLSLSDFEKLGAFAQTRMSGGGQGAKAPEVLARAVRARQTILISGGTSTAKTTLLNALAKEIPPHERVVTIEDTPELRLPHANQFTLIASRGDQGEAQVDMQVLLDASLRLRPDRILIGEIRGAEAWTYLDAISSGHPGSLSTVHASSPALAFTRLARMVLRARMGLSREEILEDLRCSIDLVVQLERSESGERVVSELQDLRV